MTRPGVVCAGVMLLAAAAAAQGADPIRMQQTVHGYRFVAPIVIGSAILLSTHAGPHWEELPLLGIAGFAIAGALGIAWAVLALKSGKL